MKINYKKLFISILIPLIAGILGNLLGGNTNIYDSVAKPAIAPPAFIFPIVWTILYTLMGISSYIIKSSNVNYSLKEKAMSAYYLQLLVNILWSFFFFRLNWFFFSFLWIILLIILVSYMIYSFYKVEPVAAYLQISYLLWLTFAGILNLTIALSV